VSGQGHGARGLAQASNEGREEAANAGASLLWVLGTKLQHSVWPLARQRTSYCSAPEPPIEGTHSQSVSA
jgi:hypothetical protein